MRLFTREAVLTQSLSLCVNEPLRVLENFSACKLSESILSNSSTCEINVDLKSLHTLSAHLHLVTLIMEL